MGHRESRSRRPRPAVRIDPSGRMGKPGGPAERLLRTEGGPAMRRLLAFGLSAVLLLLVAGAAPVAGATKQAVRIEATTLFATDPDNFVASGIPGCAAGTVVDGKAKVVFN